MIEFYLNRVLQIQQASKLLGNINENQKEGKSHYYFLSKRISL